MDFFMDCPPNSSLIQIFVVGSERRTCFETQCAMALQGHPRSLILKAPIEMAHAISYWSSIVISNLDPILPRFRDITGFLRRATLPPIPPEF